MYSMYAMHLLCSDEACAMNITEIFAAFKAPNRRCAMPGTPIIPTYIHTLCE